MIVRILSVCALLLFSSSSHAQDTSSPLWPVALCKSLDDAKDIIDVYVENGHASAEELAGKKITSGLCIQIAIPAIKCTLGIACCNDSFYKKITNDKQQIVCAFRLNGIVSREAAPGIVFLDHIYGFIVLYLGISPTGKHEIPA